MWGSVQICFDVKMLKEHYNNVFISEVSTAKNWVDTGICRRYNITLERTKTMEMTLNMGAFEALNTNEMYAVDGGIKISGCSLGGLTSGTLAGAAVGGTIGGPVGLVVGALVCAGVTYLYDHLSDESAMFDEYKPYNLKDIYLCYNGICASDDLFGFIYKDDNKYYYVEYGGGRFFPFRHINYFGCLQYFRKVL